MIVDGIKLRHVTIYDHSKAFILLQHHCHAMFWQRAFLMTVIDDNIP